MRAETNGRGAVVLTLSTAGTALLVDALRLHFEKSLQNSAPATAKACELARGEILIAAASAAKERDSRAAMADDGRGEL